MTKSILFGVALSAFASAAAYASPAKPVHAPASDALQPVAALVNGNQPAVVKSATAQLNNPAAGMVVAENRREFGSQYQRER